MLAILLRQARGPEAASLISKADERFASDLTRIECSRACHRAVALGSLSTAALPEAQCQAEDLWLRCNVMEFVPEVVERAGASFSDNLLRTLDALHVAFYEHARRAATDLVMLSLDQRVRSAVLAAGGVVLPEL